MDEENIVAVFLNETLNQGALLAAVPGRYHWEIAPDNVAYPNGAYQAFDLGNDLVTIGNHRVYSNQLWLVKVHGIAGRHDAALAAAVALQDEALRDIRWVSRTGAMIYQCYRERPHSLPVVENGIHYRQRGGLYRIRIGEAA